MDVGTLASSTIHSGLPESSPKEVRDGIRQAYLVMLHIGDDLVGGDVGVLVGWLRAAPLSANDPYSWSSFRSISWRANSASHSPSWSARRSLFLAEPGNEVLAVSRHNGLLRFMQLPVRFLHQRLFGNSAQ